MNFDEHDLERRARAIVIARTVYKAVIVTWAVAVVGMVLIWQLTTPGGYFWPVWPTLGMSIAAVVWGLAIYGKPPFRVRQDKIDQEMARMRADRR